MHNTIAHLKSQTIKQSRLLYYLVSLYSNRHTYSISDGPNAVISPATVDVVVGQEITCIATANPPVVSYEWTKDGSVIVVNGNSIVVMDEWLDQIITLSCTVWNSWTGGFSRNITVSRTYAVSASLGKHISVVISWFG